MVQVCESSVYLVPLLSLVIVSSRVLKWSCRARTRRFRCARESRQECSTLRRPHTRHRPHELCRAGMVCVERMACSCLVSSVSLGVVGSTVASRAIDPATGGQRLGDHAHTRPPHCTPAGHTLAHALHLLTASPVSGDECVVRVSAARRSSPAAVSCRSVGAEEGGRARRPLSVQPAETTGRDGKRACRQKIRTWTRTPTNALDKR